MKYYIITFGCQMNKSDSERIASILENIGYRSALKENEADLMVVNMCSVRQSAVDRVFGLIPKFEKLKTKNKKFKTVLTGCILKEDRKKFSKQFDLILDKPHHCLNIQPKYQTSFRVYIPIIAGCNNFCSYCVVPYTRGPEVSRPMEDILREIETAVKRGFKEIWLLGENVNSYKNFPKLLRLINEIPGDFWIRFTSSHPQHFSDQLINTIARSKKVTEYINLPIQSGDDEILKKMNRPYTVTHFKNLVKKIREKIPEVCLSTDIIVGFPGETKKQFQNTIKFFQEIKFDMAYIAQYSERPETAAAKMKDNLSHQEKERRDKVLTEVLKQTALENNKKYIGKTVDVLPEKIIKGFLIGKSRTYKTVKFLAPGESKALLRGEGPENLIGKFLKVKIIDALPWGLRGRLI